MKKGDIVVDIWGGDKHMDHVARFIRPIDEALQMAAFELNAGFLVNLRKDLAFGRDLDFDNRKGSA